MSSFIAIINNRNAWLATDTLCSFVPTGSEPRLVPRNFTCKTFALPQFKSVFAVTGTLQLGLCFFAHTVEFTYGTDIESLVGIDLKHFKEKLNSSYEQTPTGTIYLIGYSEDKEIFRGYKLVAGPEATFAWEELPSDGLIFKPAIANWEDKMTAMGENKTVEQFVINLMTLQKQDDIEKNINEQVGIGGEIVLINLEMNEQSKTLVTFTQIIHRFDDYFEMWGKMAGLIS